MGHFGVFSRYERSRYERLSRAHFRSYLLVIMGSSRADSINRGVIMATKVILPMLGQTMEEGTITQWFKQVGDTVEKGEALLEVLTDKVNMEVESPASGVLRKILADVDQTVPVMDVIAIIGTADEPIDDLLSETESPAESSAAEAEVEAPVESAAVSSAIAADVPASSSSRLFISPRAKRLAYDKGIDIEMLEGRGTGPEGRVVEKDVLAYITEMGTAAQVKATPLAGKVAADKGIDLREIVGSGPGGKVVRDDVLQAVASSPSFPMIEGKVIPLAGMRKMVADNVAKSAQTAPHVTLTAEVDMTEMVKVRSQILGEFERKYGTRLTFTDLIVKAVARAILDHPLINASLQGNEIRIPGEVNVGVAVALDGGLIVPVVRQADRKGLSEISSELKALVDKARTGSLAGPEISGGTFTITNLGAYGIDVFNPIITPGQSAILGVCRIAEKPVISDGQIVVRSMMNLCLSFDHRVLDGAPAAQFLQAVKALLESPYQLLI